MTNNTPKFSTAAQENIDETSTDWAHDLAMLRSGKNTAERLLADCLSGADADRAAGWREYVNTLSALAAL